MPDSSGSGAQQAVKTWPTRASLGTAAPPATRRSRPRPARAPMGGGGGGALARAGPVGFRTPTSCRVGEEDRVEPR